MAKTQVIPQGAAWRPGKLPRAGEGRALTAGWGNEAVRLKIFPEPYTSPRQHPDFHPPAGFWVQVMASPGVMRREPRLVAGTLIPA